MHMSVKIGKYMVFLHFRCSLSYSQVPISVFQIISLRQNKLQVTEAHVTNTPNHLIKPHTLQAHKRSGFGSRGQRCCSLVPPQYHVKQEGKRAVYELSWKQVSSLLVA